MNPFTVSDTELLRLVEEDVPLGDITTYALNIGECEGRMTFTSRRDMVLCGVEEAARIAQLHELNCEQYGSSGTSLAENTLFFTAWGKVNELHKIWKISQNLVEYLSGIASSAAEILVAARGANPKIALACTRKNFPGTKSLSIKAILCGGATPHRLNLSDSLMLFAEHRLFNDDQPINTLINKLKVTWPERKIAVEISDPNDAQQIIASGVDIIQLERFNPEQVAKIVDLRNSEGSPTLIGVAGGINADNAKDYAMSGADILITSAPYWAKPRDVKVSFFHATS